MKFSSEPPTAALSFVGKSRHRHSNFRARSKISIEIENFDRDQFFLIVGPSGECGNRLRVGVRAKNAVACRGLRVGPSKYCTAWKRRKGPHPHIGIVQTVFSEKASAIARIRQKCVTNASEMRQKWVLFYWEKRNVQNASEIRQNCIKNASKIRGTPLENTFWTIPTTPSALVRKLPILLRTDFVLTKCPHWPYEGPFRGKIPWMGKSCFSSRALVKTVSAKEKTHKHKQICRIVPGLGGCQNFVYVFLSGHSLWARKNTYVMGVGSEDLHRQGKKIAENRMLTDAISGFATDFLRFIDVNAGGFRLKQGRGILRPSWGRFLAEWIFRDLNVGPPDFFSHRRIFFSSCLWESAQKNPPGKSPAKSSKNYTTKIPNTFLQRGWAN